MLPERDKEAVDVDPVLLRQDVFEGGHGALRRSCVHVSPAVRNSVDVNIHANVWLVTRNTEDEMGAFGANTMERLQQPRVAWQRTAMVRDNTAGDVVNLRRFHVVKGAVRDRLLDHLWVELAYCGRSAGTGKQPMRAL
jgi:hypothetical protein